MLTDSEINERARDLIEKIEQDMAAQRNRPDDPITKNDEISYGSGLDMTGLNKDELLDMIKVKQAMLGIMSENSVFELSDKDMKHMTIL